MKSPKVKRGEKKEEWSESAVESLEKNIECVASNEVISRSRSCVKNIDFRFNP